MAYAQPQGYAQPPRGAPDTSHNYQYDQQGGGEYGYNGAGAYDNAGYSQPQNEPYHGRARYVDPGNGPQQAERGVITPQTSYIREHQGSGYGQEQGYGQEAAYTGNNAQPDSYQPQVRPPPQRLGHSATPPQQQAPTGRPMNDRPPPTRQYDAARPATSGAGAPARGPSNSSGQSAQRPPALPQNGHAGQPRPGHRERAQPQSPNSPHNMQWDNPFGSFGKAAQSAQGKPQNARGPPRPATSDGNRQGNGPRHPSDPRNNPPQQPPYDQYPVPSNSNHATPTASYDDRSRGPPPPPQAQTELPHRNPSASGQPPFGPGRGAAPNFSRVQSPPVRNQYTPPQIQERSNTMPNDVTNAGMQGQARHGTPPTFQSDLPFREGRAQTPVYSVPQYAEAQSAVIESASDPPTAMSEWTDAPNHDSYHASNPGMLAPHTQAPHDQHSAHSSYGEFFDEYYDTRHSHEGEADMPNFGNNTGHDELHLNSGTPVNNVPPPPVRAAYGNEAPRAPQQDQAHQYGYEAEEPYAQGAAASGYGEYQQYDQVMSTPVQRQPQPYPRGGGRGMPAGRGMAPRGRGYPGPQDRSMSAGPGPRPNGEPYGGVPTNGRGMPPQRGRGGPVPYGGDTRGPSSAPPGTGVPPPRGRGAPMRGGGRGRGAADALPHHPAPMRPGLAQQQSTPARPAPVRQYNNGSNPNQPPNQYRPPSISEGAPVTHAELQRLRMAITDNPGDQTTTLLLVKKLVEASSTLANQGADPKAKAKARERYIDEAYKLLKKLVAYNNQEAMFYMAECHGQGALGLAKDPKEAFLLYQSAAKLGHAPAAYRVAVCCELGENEGGGTKRDPLKAMQWYRRAATLGDLPAMYKLGVILLKGLLGQNTQVGEAVNWLQRAADRADADNPHALHELGLLYENPPPKAQNTVIPDPNYSFELFTQAAALGYKFSQYRLGQAHEYGQLGLVIDARQSIAWYSKAAVQEEHQSELALSGWYLTGSEGVIQQSDTEAYLWARKAAQAGLAKAEYAMGYFTETGIGCSANLEDAKRWYWRAASQNFPKARERLEDLRKGGARAQTRVSRTAMQKNQGDCKVM